MPAGDGNGVVVLSADSLISAFLTLEFYSGLVTGALISKTVREVVGSRIRQAFDGGEG